MTHHLLRKISCCCIAQILLQGMEVQAAPSQAAPSKEAAQKQWRLQLQLPQMRQWIVAANYQIDLNQLAQKDLGWFIADFQPAYPGHEVIEEQGITKNGVSYVVPNSQTKELFKGTYIVLATLGKAPSPNGTYRLESNFPHFRSGPPQSFYGVDAEPLLYGGVALARLSSKSTGQPVLPVIALPEEWANDIKTAVDRRRQNPTQGQLEGKSVAQLLEMLPSASPVESFPIMRELLPQISSLDKEQRGAPRQVFADARGLKRAVWLTQIIRNQSMASLNASSASNSTSIFDGELAKRVAAEVSSEDAVSLLAALQVAGVRGDVAGISGFGFDLLRTINAQTRFKTPRSDQEAQIGLLLRELRAVN